MATPAAPFLAVSVRRAAERERRSASEMSSPAAAAVRAMLSPRSLVADAIFLPSRPSEKRRRAWPPSLPPAASDSCAGRAGREGGR